MFEVKFAMFVVSQIADLPMCVQQTANFSGGSPLLGLFWCFKRKGKRKQREKNMHENYISSQENNAGNSKN